MKNFIESIQLQVQLYGENDNRILININNQAVVYYEQGELKKSEMLFNNMLENIQ